MTNPLHHSILSKSILKTLLYFDIFQYPLTSAEIFKHLTTNHVTPDEVTSALAQLSDQSIIYPIADFYSIQNNLALGSRRMKGNQMAIGSLLLARKRAKFISKFPFVRGVMASGSLSKDYMDEHSDLDFLVITKPNRLWIARMLLTLYKKIFLFNSHKYFCVNYYVDEEHLEIEEKNIFTATELATLIPLYGKEHYSRLMTANHWIEKYLPNHTPRPIGHVPNFAPDWLHGKLEAIINWVGANKMERIFMNVLAKRWEKRYKPSYSKPDFEVAFKTKEYVSKGHPKNHQRKVLDLYQHKLDEFGTRLNINWND